MFGTIGWGHQTYYAAWQVCGHQGNGLDATFVAVAVLVVENDGCGCRRGGIGIDVGFAFAFGVVWLPRKKEELLVVDEASDQTPSKHCIQSPHLNQVQYPSLHSFPHRALGTSRYYILAFDQVSVWCSLLVLSPEPAPDFHVLSVLYYLRSLRSLDSGACVGS